MMRKTILFLLVILVQNQISSGQVNMYKMWDGSLKNEQETRLWTEEESKTLIIGYTGFPMIYHKAEKNDTIINYITFFVYKNDSISSGVRSEFVYKQDPLYLLLDKKLPDFKLYDLDGNEFSSMQLLGKPTLLNYWSTYCPPCVAEIPALNMVKEKYRDKMNFIALTEETCPDDKLNEFLEKHPFDFYILQNAGNYKRKIKIGTIPRNIFIDSEGYVREIKGNYPYHDFDPEKGISENYFTKVIEELIKNQ